VVHFTAPPTARLADATGTPRPLSGPLLAAVKAAPGASFCFTAESLETTAASAPPSFVTLTGGTTGPPKRIRRSQASWIASFEVNRAAWGIGPASRVAVLGTLNHSLSLYGALEALHCGAELHLLANLRPDRQQQALASRQITLLWATPAQIRLLSGPPAPTLSHLLIGGGALDPATRTHAARLFPNAQILTFYGAAETSFITLAGDHTPAGSCGAPYPGVKIEVREGLVWANSPYLFEGYQGPPGAARRDGPFLTVGERGRLDEEGNLYLSGRADRAVQVADQTVQLEEVEAALLALPGVIEAAVIARPDAKRTHRLAAAYIPGPSAPPADTLLKSLRAHIAPTATPRSLTPLTAARWPRLPSGKTNLAALAQSLPE